jgi:hypothetical protein
MYTTFRVQQFYQKVYFLHRPIKHQNVREGENFSHRGKQVCSERGDSHLLFHHQQGITFNRN